MSSLKKAAVYILRAVIVIETGKVYSTALCPEILQNIFEALNVNPTASVESVFHSLVLLFLFTLSWTAYSYLKGIITALYVYIIEHRRIPKIKWYKKLWFCFTFPMFDLMGRISMIIALFTKVEWKPIPHNANIKICEIE